MSLPTLPPNRRGVAVTLPQTIALAFDAVDALPGDSDVRAWWAAYCVTTCTRGLWGLA